MFELFPLFAVFCGSPTESEIIIPFTSVGSDIKNFDGRHAPRKYVNIYFLHYEAFWGENRGCTQASLLGLSNEGASGFGFDCGLG